jgi:HEAT repeat protein
MPTPAEIPTQELLDALLDASTVLHPRYLYRLSDLTPEDTALLENIWPRVTLRRRRAIMEDLEQFSDADTLLYFDGVGCIALKDGDPQVRELAVQILRTYEAPDLIPTFLSVMETDSSSSVRAAAASALGSFVYLGEIDELPEKTLHHIEDRLLHVTSGADDKLVRRRALEALGFSSREEVPPLIEKAYAAKDKDWPITALFAMGRSADTYWAPQVLSKLDDQRADVRMEAATAAGELERSSATEPLRKLLDDDDGDVRAAAIWSLSQTGGEGIAEILEELLDETDDEEEAELLENALDNLAFTDDMRALVLLDISEEESDEDDGGITDDGDEDDLF